MFIQQGKSAINMLEMGRLTEFITSFGGDAPEVSGSVERFDERDFNKGFCTPVDAVYPRLRYRIADIIDWYWDSLRCLGDVVRFNHPVPLQDMVANLDSSFDLTKFIRTIWIPVSLFM